MRLFILSLIFFEILKKIFFFLYLFACLDPLNIVINFFLKIFSFFRSFFYFTLPNINSFANLLDHLISCHLIFHFQLFTIRLNFLLKFFNLLIYITNHRFLFEASKFIFKYFDFFFDLIEKFFFFIDNLLIFFYFLFVFIDLILYLFLFFELLFLKFVIFFSILLNFLEFRMRAFNFLLYLFDLCFYSFDL